MNELEIYIDGASKGNPGPSGIGVVLFSGKKVIKNISCYIGETTNNIAEYTALIFALQEALIGRYEKVKINTDSQLLYRQIKRIYKVKHPNMIGLYNQVMHLLPAFKEVVINNIGRQENIMADKLANQAVKQGPKKKAASQGLPNEAKELVLF